LNMPPPNTFVTLRSSRIGVTYWPPGQSFAGRNLCRGDRRLGGRRPSVQERVQFVNSVPSPRDSGLQRDNLGAAQATIRTPKSTEISLPAG
jgi:hypothetical protein